MKNTRIFPLAVCLILAMVLVICASAMTNQEAEQHFEKANELFKRMDYQGAIAEYTKVINLSSGSKIAQDAQYWIGQSHLRSGQFDAAQAIFAELIERYPASAIIPVTKLMVERVERAKEDEAKRRTMDSTADKGFIIDPSSGLKYTKTAVFAGRSDVIQFAGTVDLSPNGKFLLSGKVVVPVEGGEPFDLVDMDVDGSTWSPDGEKVAFSSRGIWIVPVSPDTGRATGPAKKLLDRGRSFTAPGWSPDSQKLIFRGAGDIWTLSVDDGSLTQITSDPAREYCPAWSPDGRTIAYAMIKGRPGLWLVPAEGGTPVNIIDSLRRLSSIIWSPDGQWILYESDGTCLLNVHDHRTLDIAPPPGEVGRFFSWSPDGQKMLFYRPSYGYRYGLNIVSTSGGPLLDLVRQHPFYGSLVWSRDSKAIAMQGGDENGNIVIWIVPLSGDGPVLLEMGVSVDGKPFPLGVSPDGGKLAFSVKAGDGTEDLFVVPISLKEVRTTGAAVKIFDDLRRGGAINATFSWSPDGRKVALIHRDDVWIAPSQGGKPVQITRTPERERGPGWSPDGKMVKYVVFSDENPQGVFHVVPASGGKATKIPHANRSSVWSPDSTKLATEFEGRISSVSIADGETRQIARLEDLGLASVFDLCWSPDGKRIACVGDHIEEGHSGPIFVLGVEAGEVTTLVTEDDSWKYRVHWSPDGRWIAYDPQGPIKLRPEGTMWEADFEEIVQKASR